MTPPSAAQPVANHILAASVDGCTLVVVVGKATFRLAPAFKQATQAARLAGSEMIVVDMAQCLSMDSTFMGGMASLGFALQKSRDARLAFINVTPAAMGLLKGLGLLRLLKAYPVGSLPEGLGGLDALVSSLQPVTTDELGGTELAAFMYDAHETLTRADPANVQKFKDVLAFLKQDLAPSASAPGAPASPC